MRPSSSIRRLFGVMAVAPFVLSGQIGSLSISISVSVTATQAVLRYMPPAGAACSIQVADMAREITIASAAQFSGSVTITTTASHGLVAGAVIYIENSGVSAWNGWQTVTAVPAANIFSFASAATGSSSSGNVGVLVDDVNPALFPGGNLDSRPGNTGGRTGRTFVIGHRSADIAADGNRYSRALQANARHHFTLTCGSQALDQDFRTANPPLGDTHNEGLPADRSNPGQYSYPTVNWANQKQTLIDPVTGLRSFRATGPTGTPSSTQTFQTAIDINSAWQSASGPLTSGGSASFTGPCSSGTCPLFLRADSLSVAGGATYTTGYGTGSSLDWVTVSVSNAYINNGSCQGDDCKIDACLTVNAVSCATSVREISLSSTPANYTFGTQNPMDLWQNSGAPAIARPDVSLAAGTVNYTASNQQVKLASGNAFSLKWTAGSSINVAGTAYPIASVQNETLLTLASGPSSNLTGAAYTANNFGVLIWKKTARADQVAIGYTTFQYGSTPNPAWASYSIPNCGSAVTVNGVNGYDCFVNNELYWVAQDGSDYRDLGAVAFSVWPDGRWSPSWPCGNSSTLNQFDPMYGDSWYCLQGIYFNANRQSVIQVTYKGPHTNYTPGKTLPDCGLNNGAQPCLQFTIMQPNPADAINLAGAAFNPDFAASGYQPSHWQFGGVSPDGDLMIYVTEVNGQDTKGWQFFYSLGDRTPAHTTASSMQQVAAASTYRVAPYSWCTVHGITIPEGGWSAINSNDLGHAYPQFGYTMALTGAALNANTGVAGGLNTCPPNSFGATGQSCTAITVNAAPAKVQDGTFLQNVQLGDLILIDNEYLRVIVINSPTSFTVQRGYLGSVGAHAGTTLNMACGVRNQYNSANGFWNYRNDPYGLNASGTTVIPDAEGILGHGGGGAGTGTYINGGTGSYEIGENLCPSALLTGGAGCYMVRLGTIATISTAPRQTEAMDPLFANQVGIGMPDQVDSHPGSCFGAWCLDARPMDGGLASSQVPVTLGSVSRPWTNVGGQLWKFSGGQSALHRKFLTTIAYSGRSALVDVSGAGSTIGNGAADSYKYCYALVAGECQAGSSVGDVFVNSPFVSTPYCYYAGIAQQGDDTTSICIGDLGAYTGNVIQLGVAQQDLLGALTRRLSTGFSRWNQHSVFWNAQATPNGALMFSQARWLDNVRHEDLVTVLPPYPGIDNISRNTFISIPVNIKPPSSLRVDNAIVEFGYGEYGGAGNFYCTSRQENCVAVTNSINAGTPFYYEQAEQYSGMPCSTGCTIAVPALSQHVLYYRWKYRDASGNVLATSPTQVVTTQ